MSLFRRRVETRTITSLPWNYGSDSVTAPAVTPDRALTLAPVFAAGNLLASSIASLPLQVFRKTSSGRTMIPTPTVFRTPSVTGSIHDWIFRAVLSMAYRGNAVGLITSRNALAYPTSIEWLRPDWVAVQDQLPDGPGSFFDPLWFYRGVSVPSEDIVHIPWFVQPGHVWGLNPISAFATAVNIGLSAQKYKSDWFDSGGIPPGQFKNNVQTTVDQKTADAIKRRLVKAIRTHEPIVYGKDWDYTPFTLPPHDAQFVESMQLSATQVANVYGVPPARIGGTNGESMTYSNVEQDSLNLIQWAVYPWCSRIEAVFNQYVLPQGQYCRFNLDALIRPDTAARYSAHQIARQIGIKTVNEIRDEENQAPVDGGDDPTPLSIQVAAARHSGDPLALDIPGQSGGVPADPTQQDDPEPLIPARPTTPSSAPTDGGQGR